MRLENESIPSDNKISMATLHKHTFQTIGVISGLLFAVLFFFRLDLYNTIFNAPEQLVLNTPREISEKDAWMNIYQNDAKIGYAHKRLSRMDDGFRIDEAVFMRLNTMGMVQDILLNTSGHLNADFTMNGFDFKMESSRFRFSLQGQLRGDRLIVTSGKDGSERVIMLDEKNKPFLVSGIMHAVHAAGLEPGTKYAFNIFDPATMGQDTVLVSVIEKEVIEVMGRNVEAAKVLVNSKGTNQVAWIDPNGDVVREKGLLGIRMEKTDKKTALAGLSQKGGQDLTRLASVPSNIIIDQPSKVSKLTVRIAGIDTRQLLLNGGRQSFDPPQLIVRRESLDTLPLEGHMDSLGTLEKVFLKPSPFIQSDHEAIQRLAF